MRTLSDITTGNFKNDLNDIEYSEIKVDQKIVRYVQHNRMSKKRIRTLFTKEPSTIPWLESFEKKDIMFDVGANVGMYSIYAAVISGAIVYAFEPESQNFAELNKNIFINSMYGRVFPYPMAISDTDKMSILYLSAFGPSFSHHDFDENSWQEDKQLGEFHFIKKDERFQQGSFSRSIDSILAAKDLPDPDHIKVDVDGLENRVFMGMEETLERPNLKTVLVEIDFDLPSSIEIIDFMEKKGWTYSKDQVRMDAHGINSFEQVEEMIAQKKGMRNYIFFKNLKYHNLFTKVLEDYRSYLSKK